MLTNEMENIGHSKQRKNNIEELSRNNEHFVFNLTEQDTNISNLKLKLVSIYVMSPQRHTY